MSRWQDETWSHCYSGHGANRSTALRDEMGKGGGGRPL